jgi:hypothetical protein
MQTMANYTRRNLTPYAQQSSMAFFKSWATMVRLAARLLGNSSAMLMSASIATLSTSGPFLCRQRHLYLYVSSPSTTYTHVVKRPVQA